MKMVKEYEIKEAKDLIEILSPCLKQKKNGRYDTTWGDKTEVGLLRTIKRIITLMEGK